MSVYLHGNLSAYERYPLIRTLLELFLYISTKSITILFMFMIPRFPIFPLLHRFISILFYIRIIPTSRMQRAQPVTRVDRPTAKPCLHQRSSPGAIQILQKISSPISIRNSVHLCTVSGSVISFVKNYNLCC